MSSNGRRHYSPFWASIEQVNSILLDGNAAEMHSFFATWQKFSNFFPFFFQGEEKFLCQPWDTKPKLQEHKLSMLLHHCWVRQLSGNNSWGLRYPQGKQNIVLDLLPFSWDLLLAKCLCGLCQKRYMICMCIQCSMWGNSFVLKEHKRTKHPMN